MASFEKSCSPALQGLIEVPEPRYSQFYSKNRLATSNVWIVMVIRNWGKLCRPSQHLFWDKHTQLFLVEVNSSEIHILSIFSRTKPSPDFLMGFYFLTCKLTNPFPKLKALFWFNSTACSPYTDPSHHPTHSSTKTCSLTSSSLGCLWLHCLPSPSLFCFSSFFSTSTTCSTKSSVPCNLACTPTPTSKTRTAASHPTPRPLIL